MKKASGLTACAALILSGVMAIPLTPVLADPGGGEGALVNNDAVCFVSVPKEGGGFYPGLVQGERKLVTTPAGTFHGHCRAEAPESMVPSQPITVEAMANCSAVPGSPAAVARITVLPSGALHGRCTDNPSNDD